MCKIKYTRRKKKTKLQKARLWAKANAIDMEVWPDGLKDFAEAIGGA